MKLIPLFLLSILSLFFSSPLYAIDNAKVNAQPTIKHYQVHERYYYGRQLLELALNREGIEYNIQGTQSFSMNEARGERLVISGELDIQWMSTNAERESKMIPIKIPIYRGILGLRLLLIQKERSAELSQIKSLNDLKKLTGAHGKHWADLSVYEANNLKVHALVEYEKLFKLLELGRVDYFHRGLNEIWGELKQHNKTLAVADGVMLFYPHPVYFFVNKYKVDLANRIEQGLLQALQDGSFKEHFLTYHSDFIEKGKLSERRVIQLKNPDLPDNTPQIDTSWWLQTQ